MENVETSHQQETIQIGRESNPSTSSNNNQLAEDNSVRGFDFLSENDWVDIESILS